MRRARSLDGRFLERNHTDNSKLSMTITPVYRKVTLAPVKRRKKTVVCL